MPPHFDRCASRRQSSVRSRIIVDNGQVGANPLTRSDSSDHPLPQEGEDCVFWLTLSLRVEPCHLIRTVYLRMRKQVRRTKGEEIKRKN
jgi:hypothetical protein